MGYAMHSSVLRSEFTKQCREVLSAVQSSNPMARRVVLCLLFVCIRMYIALGVADQDDVNCLAEIKGSIIQDPDHTLRSWTKEQIQIPCNGTFSNLEGVTCKYERVYKLSFAGFGLYGKISPSISNCTNLQSLNLAANHFAGKIPTEIQDLVNLDVLNLSSNELTGTIPPQLTVCAYLNIIDLHDNKLTGSIPPQLGLLSRLSVFDVSNNDLRGIIPTTLGNRRADLPQLNASSFVGNKRLFGYPLPPANHRGLSVLVIVGIGLVSGLLSLVVSFTAVCMYLSPFRFYWKRKIRGLNSFTLKSGPPRISYEEIVHATQGFNETNMIGIGSFGSVYKGTFNNGTVFAIKVLNLQDEKARRSFHRECNALRRARHRNVIKIITSCSNFDFKALVLPLMSNGNLQRWLHREDAFKLNLTERLRIAIEIAQGMACLHHHSLEPIVHCDLKPSNVLLGDDMTAYIADFGIAKLIFGDSVELASTNALHGSIGYVAPEYGLGGKVSTKGDVHSYGIVLLELLTGKKPTDDIFEGGLSLPKWVGMHFPHSVREVVDNFLLEDVNESEMATVLTCILQLMEVGLVCANDTPQRRPNMLDVDKRLDKIKGVFLGIPRAFELPIDISSLINTTNVASGGNGGNNESWSTSTSYSS